MERDRYKRLSPEELAVRNAKRRARAAALRAQKKNLPPPPPPQMTVDVDVNQLGLEFRGCRLFWVLQGLACRT